MDVDTLVDSGFTSSLALPATIVAALGLARQSGGTAILADGSIRQFDIYAAELAWDNRWQPTLVYGVGDVALLGMRQMAGHELRIAVAPGRRWRSRHCRDFDLRVAQRESA
jgi:predicted aspartyl protease